MVLSPCFLVIGREQGDLLCTWTSKGKISTEADRRPARSREKRNIYFVCAIRTVSRKNSIYKY